MIKFINISFRYKTKLVENLSLEIKDREIYFLIIKDNEIRHAITQILLGNIILNNGYVEVNGQKCFGDELKKNLILINNLSDFNNVIDDLNFRVLLDFYCKIWKLNHGDVFKNLVSLHMPLEELNKRLNFQNLDLLKKLYISLYLARGTDNIAIHNVCNGMDKAFTMAVNELLIQKRNESKSILYLTDDISFGFQIADRLSFIKNGYLMPDHPILAKDFKEMDVLKLYTTYLS